MKKQLRNIIISIIVLIGLFGCGGSGANISFVNGKVADGYLDRAIVCVDKNLNNKCDKDEASAISSKGNFSIAILKEDEGKYPLVVEVVANQTIDLDDGNVITKAYTLSTPKDSTSFISPITTLIHEEIKNNPSLNLKDATSIIAKSLSLTNSDDELLKDYVANSEDRYKKIHEVGKLTASLIAKTYDKVDTQLNSDLDDNQKKALNSLILRQIKSNINTFLPSIKNGEKANILNSKIDTFVNNTNISNEDININIKESSLKKEAEFKSFANVVNKEYYNFVKQNDELILNSWLLNDNKYYEKSRTLNHAIIYGISDDSINNMTYRANYVIQTDNSVVFNHSSGVNPSNNDLYTKINKKITILDLSSKEYSVKEILSLSIQSNTNENQLNIKDIKEDSLSQVLSFSSEDKMIINSVYNRNSNTYDKDFIYFNKSAMIKVLKVIKLKNIASSVSYESINYGVVISPITGKKWLDRNLGAREVCTKSLSSYSSSSDYIREQKNCFGDYYQWGRDDDGHEKENSSVTNTISSKILDLNDTKFIKSSSSPYDWTNIDSNGSLRQVKWSKTDGTSICPIGFRVPSSEELYAETVNYTGPNNEDVGAVKITNRTSAFRNFLKLAIAGDRHNSSGINGNQGNIGFLWTNSTQGSTSIYLGFSSSGVGKGLYLRASALPIRCIKD